jgi:hypothetical protein
MNYHETLIEVADDCTATAGQVPHARRRKKTKAVVEYEPPVKHQCTGLGGSYGGEPLSIQVRKRSTSSAGQRPSQGMLPAASFS